MKITVKQLRTLINETSDGRSASDERIVAVVGKYFMHAYADEYGHDRGVSERAQNLRPAVEECIRKVLENSP